MSGRLRWTLSTPDPAIAEGAATDLRVMVDELGVRAANVVVEDADVHVDGPAWLVEMVARAYSVCAAKLGLEVRHAVAVGRLVGEA